MAACSWPVRVVILCCLCVKLQAVQYNNGPLNVCVKGSQVLHIKLGDTPATLCGPVNSILGQKNVSPKSQQEQSQRTTESQSTGSRLKDCSSITDSMCMPRKDSHLVIQGGSGKGIHLVISHEPTKQTLKTGNSELDGKIALGMALLNTGNVDHAIQHFSQVIKEHPKATSAYTGRGTAYVSKGIQMQANADAAIRDFTAVIMLNPKNPEGWIRRAEVYSPLGLIPEALSDVNIALALRPSAELNLISGTLNFMSEDYVTASKRFEKSLEMSPDQPTAMLYLGLSLYHRGMIKQSVPWYKKVLKSTEVNKAEVHRSLGHAYRELGDAKSAYEHFTSALILEPNNALTLQSRGVVQYMSGSPALALNDFKACVSFDPHNSMCQYMKGVCYAAMGNFYEAVKSSTKVIVEDPGGIINSVVVKAHYLREYSRYLHSQLDMPLSEFSADIALDGRMKDHWVKSLPFSISNYTEQPGIQPHIREPDHLTFQDHTTEAQAILCRSRHFGPLIQYNADGFMTNVRHQRALGLAVFDVAQVAHKYWRSTRLPKTAEKFNLTWRDMFDVGVKWRRLVDPDQAVFWLDQMPEKSVKAGFNVHMTLVRGQMKNVRYSDYFEKIFQFTKKMLQHFYKTDEFSTKEFKRNVEKSRTCEDLMKVLKSQNPTNPQPGLMLSTHVASAKGHGKSKLDGVMLMLSEGSGHNLVFSMDTATTPSRTSAYHSELNYLWHQIREEVRRPSNKETDSLGLSILSFVYYFLNLMPLSRGSSAVAYAVALGLFLAAGREPTGKIPKGKEVDLEAMIGGSADAFAKQVRGWLGLKKTSPPVTSFPSIREAFPSLRVVLEALNVDMTDAHCRQLRAATKDNR